MLSWGGFSRRIYVEAYRKIVMETLLLCVHVNGCDAIFTENDSDWTEEEIECFLTVNPIENYNN